MSEYCLEMTHINKTFFAMRALSDASLKVRPSSVHALLGINGAGKSTMIKILSGIYSKDSGEIYIDGEEVQIENTKDAFENGISTVYQYPELVSSFTGYENIFLGKEMQHASGKKMNRAKMLKAARELAGKYSIDIDVAKEVSQMKPVEQEMICILQALSRNVKILILDEPTSILTEKEKGSLFRTVEELRKKDIAIIFITHRLDEVFEICDELTIFRDGVTQATLPVNSELTANRVAELMLGRKLEHVYPEKNALPVKGDTYLRAQEISFGHRLRNVSLEAKRGEVLGVFGLIGSGIDELSKAIFGAIKKTSGEIYIDNVKTTINSPAEAIRHHIFLVPGDKLTEGIIGQQSIATNVTISAMDKIGLNVLGLVSEKKKRKDTNDMIERLAIATTDGSKFVSELSGGNQQKVVVGKGLYTDADIFMFCEPTIGVDVGAKAGIYEIMRETAKDHVVILFSSDIEEVYGMADRIIVLENGKISMEKQAADTDMDEMLVHAMQTIE